MRTYISDIIPKIEQYSKKLDNLTLLTNQHWIIIDDIDKSKITFIFRSNNELIISQDGKVEKAKWEYLGYNSLLIDRMEESFLFKHGFFDENVLALKIDGKNEYTFLVNESKFHKELNSYKNVIEFLSEKYIKTPILKKNEIPSKANNRLIPDPIFLKTYHVPDYRITKIRTIYSSLFSENQHDQYFVEFVDKTYGDVFLNIHNGQTYFKAKIDGNWFKSQVHYINFHYCIVGLYKFIKTGKINKDGWLIKS